MFFKSSMHLINFLFESNLHFLFLNSGQSVAKAYKQNDTYKKSNLLNKKNGASIPVDIVQDNTNDNYFDDSIPESSGQTLYDSNSSNIFEDYITDIIDDHVNNPPVIIPRSKLNKNFRLQKDGEHKQPTHYEYKGNNEKIKQRQDEHEKLSKMAKDTWKKGSCKKICADRNFDEDSFEPTKITCQIKQKSAYPQSNLINSDDFVQKRQNLHNNIFLKEFWPNLKSSFTNIFSAKLAGDVNCSRSGSMNSHKDNKKETSKEENRSANMQLASGNSGNNNVNNLELDIDMK